MHSLRFGWHPRVREVPQAEISLWTAPEGLPKALQTAVCNALLDLARTRFVIRVQRQPGKFTWVMWDGSNWKPRNTQGVGKLDHPEKARTAEVGSQRITYDTL